MRSLARQAAVGVENVLLHQEAQRLSITDGLTSLWNYRFLNMRLAQEVERAIRFNRSLSLLVIDIDHFKEVNDRFGHQRGDAILAELANRVVTETRAQVDTVARYGGEEFVLLLPETPLEGGRVVAEKIRESIAADAVRRRRRRDQRHGLDRARVLPAARRDRADACFVPRTKRCTRRRDAAATVVVSADELDQASPSPVADDPEHP